MANRYNNLLRLPGLMFSILLGALVGFFLWENFKPEPSSSWNKEEIGPPIPFFCTSPDGTWEASQTGSTVLVSNTSKKKAITVTIPKEIRNPWAIALSPDGGTLVVQGNILSMKKISWQEQVFNFLQGIADDSSAHVHLVDVASGREMYRLYPFPRMDRVEGLELYFAAKFSKDGNILFIQGETLDIYDWPIHPPWTRILVYSLLVTLICLIICECLFWRARPRESTEDISPEEPPDDSAPAV